MKPVNFVNRMTEHFPSVFVATEPGKPKLNLYPNPVVFVAKLKQPKMNKECLRGTHGEGKPTGCGYWLKSKMCCIVYLFQAGQISGSPQVLNEMSFQC